MTRLFLIRHGEPQALWGTGAHHDPGLSEAGRVQAARAAQALAALGQLDIVSSPMKRCRETAAPFEARVGQAARIEPRVSEVMTPASVADRRAWLRENFPWEQHRAPREWSAVDPALRAWRDKVVSAVLELRQDTAVFSHFIAINAIVGAAMQSLDTIVCAPDYGTITELELRNGALELIRVGERMADGEVR
jgi:broad specificity phosphatase PhoE